MDETDKPYASTHIQINHDKDPNPSDELTELIETYQEIGKHVGNPTGIVYVSGGYDLFPIVTDSVRMLKIFDIIPLTQGISSGIDNFFEPTHHMLTSKQGEFIDIRSLKTDPRTEINFQEEVIRIYSKLAKHLIKTGFGSAPYQEPESIYHLGEVLGVLYVLGIDLDSVKIGMFGDEYRIAFQYGGVDKTVIFSSQRIDEDFATSPGHTLLREQIAEFKINNLMMISKGDARHVVQHVARVVRPNSITCDNNNKIEGLEEYSSERIGNPSHPELKWGYGKVQDIQILRR